VLYVPISGCNVFTCLGSVSAFFRSNLPDCLMGRGKQTCHLRFAHVLVGPACRPLDFTCNCLNDLSWPSRTTSTTTLPCLLGLSHSTTLASSYLISTPSISPTESCVGRIILRPCLRITPTHPVLVLTAADKRIVRVYMAHVHRLPIRSRYRAFQLLQ
jgi:hypothetical protein